MRNVIDLLQERGFIEAIAGEDIRQLTSQPTTVYCGFDPSADSLHLGNLVGIMGLAWFQRSGHQAIAIVGGATGMIGDPSGKATERKFLSAADVINNLQGIRKNLETILAPQNGREVTILNNLDWFQGMTCIEFLRDIGIWFRLGPMLAKESVRLRLQSEEGMSFTEFSYQLLQGYDFLHLYREHGVRIQLGGSDQWGNITAGTDLIRKVLGASAYGITFPLIKRSDGQKFGKSEKGAIWLSPEKLSPYEFYQYLLRVEDPDVINLLKMLTFLEIDQIRAIEKSMDAEDYEPRTAQKKLAEEVTELVHGKGGLLKALEVTRGLSPGQDTVLDGAAFERLREHMPHHFLSASKLIHRPLIDLLVDVGLQASKGEARRLMRNGGVFLNNQKIEDERYEINSSQLIEGRFLLLAVGKKTKIVIELGD